jgi:hypothetical protein
MFARNVVKQYHFKESEDYMNSIEYWEQRNIEHIKKVGKLEFAERSKYEKGFKEKWTFETWLDEIWFTECLKEQLKESEE